MWSDGGHGGDGFHHGGGHRCNCHGGGPVVVIVEGVFTMVGHHGGWSLLWLVVVVVGHCCGWLS